MDNMKDIIETLTKLDNKEHKHVMECVEHELLNAKDEDEIRLVIQGDKVEIWNGSLYLGRHLFRNIRISK